MLSLPLMSLSTAQDADAKQQKFNWQKETHDLTFVIDSYGGRDNAQLIKVVQGIQVRHLIEIERLVKEGEQLVRQMQNQGVQMQAEQLPTSAIVRNPLLAIRWRLPNQKVRRIQIRFKSEGDFDTAFNRLRQIGLHMTGHNTAPSITAPSPRPAQTLPSLSRPAMEFATSSERPMSNASIGSGLTCPPSRLAEISNRPHTAVNGSTTFENHLNTATNVRVSSATPSSDRRDTLTTASFSSPLNPPVLFPRPQSATADILSRSWKDASSFSDHSRSTVEERPQASTERPETAMLFNRPGTAELLPPRRELPFQRLSEPRSSGSDSGRTPDSRPSTGLMGPPALPRSAAQRPGSSRSANSKDVELPPLPQPTVIDKVGRGKQPMQQAPLTPNQDQSSFQLTKTSPNNRSGNAPSLTVFSSPVSSPLSFTNSSSPNSVLPHNQISEANGRISNASVASGTTVGANDAEHLAAYTMQPDEARRAALNEFIFRHLESDEFLTLVEDMETAWARVALGMR
ncbi:hypothetical protein COCMIDRAFT_40085 [Bipolaris oryzae ATCC 44560]|uniref:Uncharacterized protein n=1 Tax=Bipolaris oryzae ATCC 44560 TaxID=930090 RepID=W6ZE53_COCMI|nr:uncharacterized protein COCMIDRAFT_40085 [Bipolaris oryzae ATCC 44560]EUC41796.1 hypothetical protein COCMIDRAFT_40085 [Bipolaris oryzae ATCC 44560]